MRAGILTLEPPLSRKDLLDLLRLASDASDYEVRGMATMLAREVLIPAAPPVAARHSDDGTPSPVC